MTSTSEVSKKERIKKLRNLFDRTQELSEIQNISETDITEVIAKYRDEEKHRENLKEP